MNKMKEYLKKLFKGEISLFISFWFLFIGLSFFLEIFFQPEFNQNPFVHNDLLEFLLFFLMLIYAILIFMIIFKSANNYKGSKLWSFLAKMVVTINLFFSLSFSIDTIKFYFLEDYAIEKEIEDFKTSLPIQVDSLSVLIDIYKKNKTIFYNYQLFDVSLEKDVDKNRFKKQIQNSLMYYLTQKILHRNYQILPPTLQKPIVQPKHLCKHLLDQHNFHLEPKP